jgi:hypothetical protein
MYVSKTFIRGYLTLAQVPREIKRFDSNPIFMERPSERSDAAWHNLGGRTYLFS